MGSAVEFNYGHDAIHQVIDQEASDKRFIWTPLASLTESYASPNNLNQYPTVASVNFSYNANGCLTGDGIWTFGYDTLNRMISADDGTVSASYLYDPLNRQGQKNVDGVKERFVYDGIQRIADYDGSTDTLIRRFVFGVGLDEPLIEVSSAGDLTCIHQDRQGSVIAFTDDTGTVLSRHAYGPFGEDSNLSGTAFGYSGQRFDPETGLYFCKSRYYSPRLGRFLQPDPIGYGAGLHLYSYVGDSPVTLVDPLGLAAGRMAMEIPTVEVARQPGGKSWYDVPAVGATDSGEVIFIPTIWDITGDGDKPAGDTSSGGSGGGGRPPWLAPGQEDNELFRETAQERRSRYIKDYPTSGEPTADYPGTKMHVPGGGHGKTPSDDGYWWNGWSTWYYLWYQRNRNPFYGGADVYENWVGKPNDPIEWWMMNNDAARNARKERYFGPTPGHQEQANPYRLEVDPLYRLKFPEPDSQKRRYLS